MRTVLCANGALGARVARHLHERGDLVGLVLHAPERQRDVASLADLDVPTWTWADGDRALEGVAALEPACLLSVLFAHRFDEAWLAVPSWRPVNLHPGLLPYNAGANPNVWPLVDGTPAGTTLHVMSPVIDDGDLIAQAEVAVAPDDTAATLYDRLMEASYDLFVATWPAIASIDPRPMPPGGTRHRVADLAQLDPSADELALIDRLRARTFPPYGAEFERNGRRWRAQITITPIDDAAP
jgi:methionyl-tRNA formyltransferase